MTAAIERMAGFIRPTGIAAALAIVLISPLQVVAEDAQMPPIAVPSPAAGPEINAGDTFKPGDIAATGFSGSKLTVESLPPGVDPVMKSFLDPDGAVLRIYSLSNLRASNSGQTLDPTVVFQAKARDIGHVFGLAFDNLPADQSAKPGLFAAASSAFGLQIVGPDKSGTGLARLWNGAPGAAFMSGQFGGMPGAGPGTIYKIDRVTGDVRIFTNVSTNGAANSGPGIGGLAFDPASRTLYASDLDTGLIHAFAADGTDIAQFDHGVDGRPLGKKGAVGDNGKRADIASPAFAASNPATWGFTQAERRIDALAIHDGRLFYAAADGPEIWSIGIDPSRKFGKDPRFELAVAAAKAFPITAIVFDQAGRMTIAQRGALESPSDYSQFTSKGPAQTLRFTPENPDDPNTPEHWKPAPDEYAVGNIEDFRAASGGLAVQYAYKDDGSIDLATCGGTIIVSGDTLGAARNVSGLQLGKINLVRPANAPPVQSAVVELDPDQNDPAARGHAGGIAVLQDCGGAGGFPPLAGGGAGGDFPAVAGDNAGGGFPPVVGGDAGTGGGGLPPVADTQEGGGGKTDDGTQEGGGGKTTNGVLTMTKSPGSATCSENQSCSYTIAITNNSGQPVPGPVVISDVLSVGGAPFQKAKLDPPPAPWTCVGSAAPGMQCTHPGPVDPNVPLDLTLGFTPELGSLAGATELKNCVSFPGAPAAQGNGAQQLLPSPPAPTGTSNGGLKVETLGTSPSCSPATGNCEFEIKITNNTGQAITDQPLKIFDTLAVGTQTQAKNEAKSMQLPAGLQCTPQGREFNCSQDSLTLAPNQSVSLKVAFSVDTTEGGQANFVQNKTNVTLGPQTGEATAAIAFTDDAKLPEPGADGQQAAGAGAGTAAPACASIPVAPSGPIVVNKKGPAKCPLKGPCAFTIDLTNGSAAPVSGPIEIVDTIDLPNATIAGAVAAPFACDPGGPPFKCRFNGTLQPKETKTLSLTLNIDALAGTKSLKNCAVPTQPQAAAPGQGQGPEQKQLAPGKKSDLFPFGRKPLVDLGAFRPQSFGTSTPLFHLVGGAGGNIGGVGQNKCFKFAFPNAFSVRQSNDVAITLDNASANSAGQFLGSAHMFMSKTGAFQGDMGDGRHPKFRITWQDGTVSTFTGVIDDSGTLTGITQNRTTGQNLRFTGLQPWKCAVDELCQNYGNDAVAAATEFQSLKCGAVGPGRWSTNPDEHIKWCMAQTRGGGSPISAETDARKTQLDSCRELDADCTAVGRRLAVENDQMKALGCKDAIPSLQPDAAKAICRLKPLDKGAMLQSSRQKLDACKAALAANGQAPNGGAAGNAGGGADGKEGAQAQQPPANQCVTVELEDKNPPDQKQPGPEAKQLAIAKNPVAAQCSATGGGCAFMVSITNPADAPEFNGPITVNDHVSAPDDTPFPNVTMVTPVNAIQPEGVVGDISCKKDGSDITCTSAAMKIPPGKTIQLPMTFTPGNGSVAKAIKNCASFPGGEKQCTTIPLTDGPLLRANKIGGGTTCVPECAFSIVLTNVGNSDATGPFVLSEDFTPMGPGVKIEVIDGDFACNQVGTKVGCISTNKKTDVLRPGESTNGRVKISGAGLSPEYKNCLSYDPNAQAKPSPFDNEWPGRCVTVKETNPFRAKLDIFKAVRDLTCKVGGSCAYDIIVSNFGSEYSGPIEILDEVPTVSSQGKQQPQPAGVEPIANADFSCTKLDPRRLSCTKNAQTLGSGGANVTLPVLVTPGPRWKKNDVVENCATLKAAPGTIGDGKQVCAQYTLDPFNVKVSKTGDQSCAPGSDCHFTLNLFNPGPIDHNAPVTISDHLNGLSSAQILSIKPPLPCASQPTQIPFSCTSPDNVCLDSNGKPGEKCGPQIFEMVVHLPNDASAQQFSNCASVTEGEKTRSDGESCATVSLKPVAAQTPPPTTDPHRVTPTPPPVGECMRGMILIGGVCQCPSGTLKNGRCSSDIGNGHAYPIQSGTEAPPPPAHRCSGGMILIDGACHCPSGTLKNGRCSSNIGSGHAYPAQPNPEGPKTTPTTQRPPAQSCPEHSTLRRNRCVCFPGFQPIGRRCVRVQQPDGGASGTQPTKDKCAPGQNRDPGTGVCFSCSHNDHFENGRCVPNSRPVVCQGNSHLENGTCVPNERPRTRKCPPGYKVLEKPNRYGAYCEPPATGKCPPSAPEGTPPNCHCPAGTVTREGFCRPINCPNGWTGLPPHCEPPKPNPTPTGPTPHPVPQKPTCSGDKVPSTSGQCVCPNGTTDVGHNRCADRVR